MNTIVLKNRIKENRGRLDITQGQLAKVVGISRETLGKFERGATPDLITAMLIAKAFDLMVTDLFYNLEN